MKTRALVLALVLWSLPAAAAAEVGLALSFTLAHAVGYAPDVEEVSTSRPFAFQFAYRVKPKVAVGISAEAYQSQVDTEFAGGKRLDEVTAIPIAVTGYYYPLDGTFNPYLLGAIGPVLTTETYTTASLQPDGTTALGESSASGIGPMIGFGTGLSFRWPVTPLSEIKCQLGFPDGERVSRMAACGLSVGVGMTF